MAREVAEAEARRFGRAAGLLSIGIGSAGLLTYVYFSLASHILDKVDYGEVVVLWSAVFVTISTLFRPVEQLLSRTIAERQAREQPIGQPLRVAATIQLGLAAAFAVVRPRPAGAPPGRAPVGQRDPVLDPGRAPRSPSARASSRAAFWPAAGASPSTPCSCSPSPRPASRLRSRSPSGSPAARPRSPWGSSPRPLLSLTVVPLAFAGRAVARSRAAAGAVGAGIGSVRVHPRRGRRLRRRRAPDHGLGADPPERRAPAGQGLRGRGGGGLHLQRADDRARPARPLPGGGHQPAPAPDAIALQRRRARRGGLPALGPADDRRDRRLRGCRSG